MTTVGTAAKLLLLRPLVGFDKDEISAKARDIGTYDISIRPDEDCCTLFSPKHPATKTRKSDIKKIEAKLNIEMLVNEALKNIELKTL
jgi:thiamine biosynthesis protein ThiI